MTNKGQNNINYDEEENDQCNPVKTLRHIKKLEMQKEDP